MTAIAGNLARIRSAVHAAASRCGRDPTSVRIVAVSKRVDPSGVMAAQACGQHIFGENYLQEAAGKISQVSGPAEWHCIGHLQSNKAALAAELFHLVHTVDRLKIAQALDRHAERLGRRLAVLVQVNVGREPQKSGVLPEEAERLLRQLRPLACLRVLGLMTMPPDCAAAAEASRPFFRALNTLSCQLGAEGLFHDNQAIELSMGMSDDFPVAIEEGATLIRIGTALFGQRPA